MGKFGVSELQNPEPIERKFGTGYYISDTTSYAKIQKDRPSGGVWANGSITLTPFFFCDRIFAHAASQNCTSDFYVLVILINCCTHTYCKRFGLFLVTRSYVH